MHCKLLMAQRRQRVEARRAIGWIKACDHPNKKGEQQRIERQHRRDDEEIVRQWDVAVLRIPQRSAIEASSQKPTQQQPHDAAVLRATDVTAAKSLVARLRKEGFEVQSIDIILDTANRIFSVITVMLSLVGGIALFVASIGIVNTMIMSIYERTREIGTLKAMGASRGDIRMMFMIEAGLIGLIGGTVGLLLGWLLGRGLNRAALWYAQNRDIPLTNDLFIVTPTLALQSLAFAFLIGVVAGLYPANRAARLDPLTALRHE